METATKQMKMDSPWDNYLRIAIECWSRQRARDMAGQALCVVSIEDMETFLTRLLIHALVTFDETYNKGYNEHIEQMWRLLQEKQALTPPTIIAEAAICLAKEGK